MGGHKQTPKILGSCTKPSEANKHFNIKGQVTFSIHCYLFDTKRTKIEC